eukprot:gene24356-26130_t
MNEGEDNSGFGVLARYIGVFGKPENDQKAALAMTAPVITQSNLFDIPAYTMRSTDKQSMTMQFVLPFHLKSINEVPVPINSKVVIRAIPSRIIAVTKFSGAYSPDSCNKQFTKLKSSLVAHKLLRQKAANTDETDPTVKWSVAQYHPPFTLPFFRRNEIWI